jgi:bifunctional oligoribonuclease and PAP phosphatase NrnA
MGKAAIPLASSALPSYTDELPGIERVAVYKSGAALPDHDLIIMVDTASLARVGRVYDEHGSALMAHSLVIVDHHVTNVGEGSVNLINAGRASCAELVFDLLKALHAPVSAAAATCLQLGITTDTQSYQTNSTNAASLQASAELVALGADQRAIVQRVYFQSPYSTLLVIGNALAQLQREGDILWTQITTALIRATGAEDEAGDEVVKLMQRCEGGRIFVLFKERFDGTVKVSLRSVPGIDVATIAQLWGGGGHRQAAGATLQMGLEDAQATVLAILRTATQSAVNS